MIVVANGQWTIHWNEQNNELLMVPKWDNDPNRSMLVSGGQARELVALVQAAMQLPSGNRGD